MKARPGPSREQRQRKGEREGRKTLTNPSNLSLDGMREIEANFNNQKYFNNFTILS